MVSKGKGENRRKEIPMRPLQLWGPRVASKNAAKVIATTVASQGIGHMSVTNPKRRPRTLECPTCHKGTATPTREITGANYHPVNGVPRGS